jgi:hypothetical protein
LIFDEVDKDLMCGEFFWKIQMLYTGEAEEFQAEK